MLIRLISRRLASDDNQFQTLKTSRCYDISNYSSRNNRSYECLQNVENETCITNFWYRISPVVINSIRFEDLLAHVGSKGYLYKYLYIYWTIYTYEPIRPMRNDAAGELASSSLYWFSSMSSFSLPLLVFTCVYLFSAHEMDKVRGLLWTYR